MSNSTKKWVYVAGPYSQPDPVENSRTAIAVAEGLEAMGVIPIVPHLTLMWHLVMPHPAKFWYDYTLELMKRCDAVYRIPGYSLGADREVTIAREMGLAVLMDWHELGVWLSKEVYRDWKKEQLSD